MDKVHANGNATFTAGGTIAKGNVVKFDDDGKMVAASAASDAAIGVALDSAASGEIVPVAILGSYCGTVEVLAAGTITLGAQIGADAKVTAAATDVIVGRALTAASSGELFEVAHQVGQVK